MTTALGPLLRLLEGPSLPQLAACAWRERFGPDVVSVLERAGLLVAAGTAEHLPCPVGSGCAMRIVPNPASAARPLVAVCERDDGEGCEPIDLSGEDATLLAAPLDGLVRQLRRAFGVTASVDVGDAGFLDVIELGQIAARPVFLARQPGLPGFTAWLASLPSALVLVPTARALPSAVTTRFSAGSAVELRALDACLRLDGHRLVVDDAARVLSVRDPAQPSYVPADAVCEVIDGDGRRPLSAAAYAELVAEAESFDLFLDTTAATQGGSYPGLRRLEDGTVERVALTKHEAAAIMELVTTGRALRAGDFKTLTVSAVDKVVEHARRKLDVKLGRYEWRAIHTLSGATPEAKRWQFRGEGLRWAVVQSQAA